MGVQMRGAECVVMAGDPQQLPPTVVSKVALECDLHHTTFDRLQVNFAACTCEEVCDVTSVRCMPAAAELLR